MKRFRVLSASPASPARLPLPSLPKGCKVAFSSLLRVQLILLTLLLLLEFSNSNPQLPQVPYSDFIALVENNKVNRAIIGDNWIEYVLKTDTSHKPTGTFGDNSFTETATEQAFATTPVAIVQASSELDEWLQTGKLPQDKPLMQLVPYYR